MKPIIGITTYGRNEVPVDSSYYDAYFAVPAAYVDAVRRAGGVAVLLPPGEANWADALAALDGLVITGGADIDPARYGGDNAHPHLTRLAPDRDASDFALLHTLLAGVDAPTLCICRGMQVLNVALGGAMHEHIPDVQPVDIHRGEDGGWTVQPFTATADSKVAAAMQAQQAATFSGHHQAIKSVAAQLHVTASAPDGIIEALEHAAHPWLVGVQWHPECSAHEDVTQQRLFDALVEKARIYREQRDERIRQATPVG
ncbi:MAG: gamma-glutamyl-gamma-aminobutyrate hydrolase family protein [Caldilineaceae bacterium]